MMYVSVYPVAISIRKTNVYEEKSLGLFASEEDEHASFLGMALKQTPKNQNLNRTKQIEINRNKS